MGRRGRSTTHIRVSMTTYERLQMMHDRLQQSYERHQMESWWYGDSGPTFDEMIAWLISHVRKDRRRSKASRARAKERRRSILPMTPPRT